MNNQRQRWFRNILALLLSLGVCLSGTSAQAQFDAGGGGGDLKPIAIITLSGYDDIIKDVDFIGSLAGQQQASMQLEMMIQMFTQNKGLAGLDKSRPLGVVVLTDGMSFPGAVCVPVTDLDALLAVLEPFGVTVEDQGDQKMLNVNGQTMFVKAQGDWALVAPMPQMMETLPANPGEFFAPLAKQYDLGVQVFVQNVPEPFRQMAVQQFTQSMEAGLKQLPGESDEEYALRKSVAQAQMQQITQMIEEMDELTLGLSIDGDQQRALFDFAVTGVEGSALAKQITEYSDAKTNFAGFFQPDAAMMMSFSSKVTDDEVAQFNQMFDALSQQMMKTIDEEAELPSDEAREAMKSAVGDFLDAFKETIEGGTMDGGAVLNVAPQSATFVAGGLVVDPAKVESGLKKIAELAEEDEDFPGIEWDGDSHGNVRFHTMSVPIPEHEEEPRQLFGDKLDIAVGIGEQSAYVALGRDCIDAVKQVIDRSKAEPNKAVAPAEMTFSLGQIFSTIAAVDSAGEEPVVHMIADMLKNEGTGRDHVRFVVQPVAKGLRYRIEIEEGVLKAIGLGIMAAQQQGAGF